MPCKDLASKIAIVTGAAGGISGATVVRLVEEGCRVVAVDAKPGAWSDGVLLSDEASFRTGGVYTVDGGLTA